jgi:cytochrome c nitrite reductase small subunit
MKALLHRLMPPPNWRLPVILLLGIFTGLSFFVIHISNASSYLSDSPETCINCHVMETQYVTWMHGSHRETATCNDCHVPHNNVFNKYFFKAKDGLRHATMFTFRLEPQVIQIKEAGKGVVQGNCVRCHSNVVNDPNMVNVDKAFNHQRTDRQCWDCHRETPHGTVTSLAAVPNSLLPGTESHVSERIIKLLDLKPNQNPSK